jgi:beta-lactamase class A
MKSSLFLFGSICGILVFLACESRPSAREKLKQNVLSQIDSVGGEVAVAFINLEDSEDHLFINADTEYHAASTMKVPVMITLFKDQHAGRFNLGDTIVLKNEFHSIVDSSLYEMDIADDSDDIIYNRIGTRITLYDLMVPMITVSSNLATNVLIEHVGATRVTDDMRALGAEKIRVLRGVEDQKAYDLGLNNTTTARDLATIFKAIATNKAGTTEDCQTMISILEAQQFNEIIPFYLPDEVRVAHKTGSITALHHDAGIVYLPSGKSYVLVLMSRNLNDFDAGTQQLAKISKLFYTYMSQ